MLGRPVPSHLPRCAICASFDYLGRSCVVRRGGARGSEMTETAVHPGLTAGIWTIDPAHSEITFSVRHLMTTVRGSFTEFGGSIEIADDPFLSTATAEIAIASIDTRNA